METRLFYLSYLILRCYRETDQRNTGGRTVGSIKQELVRSQEDSTNDCGTQQSQQSQQNQRNSRINESQQLPERAPDISRTGSSPPRAAPNWIRTNYIKSDLLVEDESSSTNARNESGDPTNESRTVGEARGSRILDSRINRDLTRLTTRKVTGKLS